jgi:branched-chain amino acid transport system substrate-binding protein
MSSKKNKKGGFRVLLVALLLVLMVFVSGCTHNIDLVSPDTTKIGVVLPLTGPLSALGESEKNGILLALEEFPNIEIYFEDGQANPKTSLSAAQNLITIKDVDYIITSFRGASLAIGGALHEQVPVFAYTATTQNGPIGIEGGNFFPIGPEMVAAGNSVGTYARDAYDCTAVGVISEDTSTGRDKSAGFLQGYGEDGITAYFNPESITSFKSDILKLQEANVDCVFFEVKPGTAKTLYKEMIELDWKPQVFANSYTITPAIYEDQNAIEVVSGAVFSSSGLIRNSDTERFFQNYETRFGSDPDDFSATMYDFTKYVAMVDEICAGDANCVSQYVRANGFSGELVGDAEVLSTGDGLLTEYSLLEVGATEFFAAE